MKVICLEEEALYELVEQVVKRVLYKYEKSELKWIDEKEVMKILGVKSKSTIWQLRKTGQVRYSQPTRKNIMYDIASVYELLEKHVREKF